MFLRKSSLSGPKWQPNLIFLGAAEHPTFSLRAGCRDPYIAAWKSLLLQHGDLFPIPTPQIPMCVLALSKKKNYNAATKNFNPTKTFFHQTYTQNRIFIELFNHHLICTAAKLHKYPFEFIVFPLKIPSLNSITWPLFTSQER